VRRAWPSVLPLVRSRRVAPWREPREPAAAG